MATVEPYMLICSLFILHNPVDKWKHLCLYHLLGALSSIVTSALSLLCLVTYFLLSWLLAACIHHCSTWVSKFICFITSLQAQVNLKIKQAFCPPNVVDGNPCLEYIKYIVFPWFEMFEVVRKEANGGNK